jgi:predicted dienelactone hydrolase
MSSVRTLGSTVISTGPIVLPASPERGQDLQVRVTAPLTGANLPVIVFSHGFGQSMTGYAPLVDHWAANGFAVVQPTHLDSRTLALPQDDPRQPQIWRLRISDLTASIDQLDAIEAAVPGLAGRVDHGRIAAAGHSWGATTVSFLLGVRTVDDRGLGEDLADARVRAGILLAAPGTGGENLTAFAAQHFPFMTGTFDPLTTPTLVVAGDKDQSFLSEKRGPDWFTDAYRLAPGAEALLSLFGAEHSLGGITGYASTETTDENPAAVTLIQQTSTAYLRSALGIDSEDWKQLQAASTPAGSLVTKAGN